MSLGSAFETPDAKRRHVARLFDTIAPRYDVITRVLSYGQDRRWKARLIRDARIQPGDIVVDLACGTGDLARRAAAAGASRVVGVDLTPRMLLLARTRATGIAFVAGDMCRVPLATGLADCVTTGYGLRNVPDLDAAIAEIARVTKPGGRFLSLDFNRPDHPLIRAVFLTYLHLIGSLLGWVLHGDADTYRYIPASIRRYPGAHGVAALLASRGFTNVRVVPLLFGLMTLHTAIRR